MRAGIEIAIDLGLRRGEMLKIRNRDIDWRAMLDHTLAIRPANAMSRRQRRIAVVSPRGCAWLPSGRPVGGSAGHPYGDAKGGRVTDFRPEWGSMPALAGIPNRAQQLDGDLHWHDLLRNCGTASLNVV
jgi:integrase